MYNYKNHFLRNNKYSVIYGFIEYVIICVQIADQFVTSRYGLYRNVLGSLASTSIFAISVDKYPYRTHFSSYIKLSLEGIDEFEGFKILF